MTQTQKFLKELANVQLSDAKPVVRRRIASRSDYRSQFVEAHRIKKQRIAARKAKEAAERKAKESKA